ncbi:protein phosphatase 2C domain-containing protein [Streptomyces seoulensis]|uniref:protein phosphatase 2C domain-containing protein n=1 Tax=Streptomyces seoulensis TaxID=73044 RepID=UPI003C2E5ACE
MPGDEPVLERPAPQPAESSGPSPVAYPGGSPLPPSPTGLHGESLRGVPAHVGQRPPSYPPRPLRCPSLEDGDEFAAFTPAVLLDGAEAGRLTVRAASVRGDSHNWEGSCRQDAMTLTRIGPPGAEFLLLAVADGLGSARNSHSGSYQVTRQVALHLHRAAHVIDEALKGADESELRALANKVIAHAVSELPIDQDHATTLHVLLVPTDAAVRERVLFSVGDGGLFILRDGHWTRRGPADESALLDTRTEALPHAYRSVKAALFRSEPGEVLLLGTDGITNPLTQRNPEFAQYLAGAWGGPEIPSLSDFLWQAQTRAKSYDDDRTVICVWEEGA